MNLPSFTYNKEKRKKNFQRLPKGAYVIKILEVILEANKNNTGKHLTISFDIAEGDYKDFYMSAYKADSNEDKKWNSDAIFYLTVPGDNSPQWAWDKWNTFFSDLKDSNNGFVFDGNDLNSLKGKLIGGKFHIEQSEFNGNIYDHVRFKWSCVADDVRNGKAGRLPNDKLIEGGSLGTFGTSAGGPDDFMKIPDTLDEELPFK